MNKIQIFNNVEFGAVRTINKGGEPWFVGKDIADILGYRNGSRDVSRHVDEDDKSDVAIHDGSQNRKMTIINESGLYSMILSSKLPNAKKFKKWVTGDVLPAIRKHGLYAVDELLANPDMFIRALEELKAERAARNAAELQSSKQKQIIGELKPRADYTDKILKNKGLVTITQIAQDYGLSGKALNKKLHDLGVQYKQSNQWLLYAKHQGKGYTHSETTPIIRTDGREDIVMNTKWTQKGRLFLYNLLKDNGILPDIERKAS